MFIIIKKLPSLMGRKIVTVVPPNFKNVSPVRKPCNTFSFKSLTQTNDRLTAVQPNTPGWFSPEDHKNAFSQRHFSLIMTCTGYCPLHRFHFTLFLIEYNTCLLLSITLLTEDTSIAESHPILEYFPYNLKETIIFPAILMNYQSAGSTLQ